MAADKIAAVETVEIGAEQAGQRIDNFLIKRMKGVPKTRLYRALRSGEVRVNGARKKPPYQLCAGDKLRIPPLRQADSGAEDEPRIPQDLLAKIPTLFEDEHLLVVDKPAGLAAHGGSGMRYGLIEALRKLRADVPVLELVHRLDRETSGCLMLAKSRAAMQELQAQLTARSVDKNYTALIKDAWAGGAREVDKPLFGRGIAGKKKLDARSVFSPRREWGEFADCALVNIRLLTGRKHQARQHAAAIGQPIAGDRLYGNAEFNHRVRAAGLRRLFLHAERLRFVHPVTTAPVELHAPLPAELEAVLEKL